MRYILLQLTVVGLFLLPGPENLLSAEFDHSLFDEVLKGNVSNGLVDYDTIKKNDAKLMKYLKLLEEVSSSEYNSWNREAKLAYWINAYNAITVYAIIKNYPIKKGGIVDRLRFPANSIRQIADVWDTVYIKAMGKDITLNQIEHEVLRKEFKEPRIHFAIVCASIGCPVLLNSAFVPEKLEAQLDTAAKIFVSDHNKVFLDEKDNKLRLSSILDWFGEDFKVDAAAEWHKKYNEKNRGVVQFISKYLEKSQKDYLIRNTPEIEYLDYDWSLNELTERTN